jgi:hypothetical protein
MIPVFHKLAAIQAQLKAPKSQYNSFGNYKYRKAEDILEAVKPLPKQHGGSLTISDSIEAVGDRIYVKATCIFREGEQVTEVSGYARDPDDKKGMDASQITGTASSYARKYALNGLFLIDDTKDPDALPQEQENKEKQNRPASSPVSEKQIKAIEDLAQKSGTPLEKILAGYKVKDLHELPAITATKIITTLEKRAKAKEDNNNAQ